MGSDEAFTMRDEPCDDCGRYVCYCDGYAASYDRMCAATSARYSMRRQHSLALSSLGQQLTIAAGLTRAYDEGAFQSAAAIWDDGVDCVSDEARSRAPWYPGCGKQAP